MVSELLQLLKSLYDVVVVDTPPAFTDQVLTAFDASDHLALLTTLDIPALKNLKLSLETLDLLGYSQERFHVVLNRADSKVGLAIEDVQKTLKLPDRRAAAVKPGRAGSDQPRRPDRPRRPQPPGERGNPPAGGEAGPGRHGTGRRRRGACCASTARTEPASPAGRRRHEPRTAAGAGQAHARHETPAQRQADDPTAPPTDVEP